MSSAFVREGETPQVFSSRESAESAAKLNASMDGDRFTYEVRARQRAEVPWFKLACQHGNDMSAQEVDAYLAGLDEPRRRTLKALRRSILAVVPDAPTTWPESLIPWA